MIFLDLFLTFLKIGTFTFGGGYAMLPLIQEEVAAHGWLSNTDLIDFVAVSESTPGPFAINIATYVGMKTGGIPGALCSTFGVVLPSFVIILLVARFYEKFKTNRIVSGCMTGLKPAVIGMIGAAVLSIGKTVFFPSGLSTAVFSQSAFYISIGITALGIVLSFKKVHPILVILLAGGIGVAVGFALGL